MGVRFEVMGSRAPLFNYAHAWQGVTHVSVRSVFVYAVGACLPWFRGGVCVCMCACMRVRVFAL